MQNDIIKVSTTEIDENFQTAVKIHQRIIINGAVCAQTLLEICKDLKIMRDEKLYEHLGYDSFDDYTEKAVGIKPRQAYTYIQTLERLGPSVLQSNANLGITKLNLLSQMNPVERQEIIENDTFSGMSVSEIKALIEKSKQQGEQISLLQAELEEAKSQAEDEYDAEKDELTARVEELEKELLQKSAEHKTEIEKMKLSAEKECEELAAEKSKKLVEEAVEKVKKEAKQKAQTETEKKDKKIKELEAALSAATSEAQKLEKQLSVADNSSAKAMVYIKNIQDSFNSLFSTIAEMPSDEQKNKFKGACLKLLNVMKQEAEK